MNAFREIKSNKINLEAEIFSLDGKDRFQIKLSGSLEQANKLGIEAGKVLKNKSNNSYKK